MGLELFRTGIRILTRGCIPTPLPLSDDDPSMLEDSALDECAVEFYVASKEPYRKAARGKIPMPWPYESRRVDDHARNIIEDKYGDYFDILEYFGISAKHITTENLTCSETNQSRDTIIITTTDENPERWQEAATIIEQHSYDPWRPESDNLVVEIRNADKMYTEYASSLPRSSRSGGNGELVMAARAIGRFLPDYLDRVAPGAWYFAEICWSQLDGQSRDLKPIIWVLFLPGTRALWSKLEQELKEAIEAITMPDLVVEFRLEFGAKFIEKQEISRHRYGISVKLRDSGSPLAILPRQRPAPESIPLPANERASQDQGPADRQTLTRHPLKQYRGFVEAIAPQGPAIQQVGYGAADPEAYGQGAEEHN